MKLLEDFNEIFQKKLNACLLEKKQEYLLVHKDAPQLIDILSEFMGRKSNRIRPAMFYFSYQNRGGSIKESELWKIALAIEFVHTLALIHDDIIDRSDLRRNKATIHTMYGNERAILLGDLSLTIADELYSDAILNLDIEVQRKLLLNKAFNKLKQETIIGEYLDVQKSEDILTVMKLKTAQYTFEKPAVMGMLLTDMRQAEIDRWSQILTNMGIAFQMYDDFVGSFGDERTIGKSTDSDIKEGKNTFLSRIFLKRASESDREQFLSFFGSDTASQKDLDWFRSKSQEYEVVTTVRHDIETKINHIKSQIDDINSIGQDLNAVLSAFLQKLSDFSFLPPDSIAKQPLTGL